MLLLYTILSWLVWTCLAGPIIHRQDDGNLINSTYDFVVVGCGVAGLVVATRLSEDPDMSVLCLEAGEFDRGEDMIRYPVYIGLQPPGFYEWGLQSVPQAQLDGAPRWLPMGRGVGGGSLINGMVWNRGMQQDYDAWETLGNPGWNWQSMLPYFKKSETYTPRFYPGQPRQPATYIPAMHGTDGPIQVSYPEYFWNQTNNWFDALREINIPISPEPNDGTIAGGYFLPSSIDPRTQTRSDTRRAYYDHVSSRENLQIATNSQALRVTFGIEDDGLRATAVEFSPNAITPRRTVFAAREVILAAGAIHTPQLLELSGIGQLSILRSLGIPVLVDLPGVGNNLQDHTLLHVNYEYQNKSIVSPSSLLTNATFNALAAAEYLSSRTGPWTSKPSTGLAFPSLTQTTNTTQLRNLLSILRQSQTSHLPETYRASPALQAGFAAQYGILLSSFSSSSSTSSIPAWEILNSNSGNLDLSLMHPLSRGTSHITSLSPFTAPAINPRYLTSPFDLEVAIYSLQFNTEQLLRTKSLTQLLPSFPYLPSTSSLAPGATPQQEQASPSRTTLIRLLRQGVGTEYHYAGTAAMMPRTLGGVVDAQLRVYGTSNLRVVDTSVFPLIPGAHLMSVAYAVAERAADVIKGVID